MSRTSCRFVFSKRNPAQKYFRGLVGKTIAGRHCRIMFSAPSSGSNKDTLWITLDADQRQPKRSYDKEFPRPGYATATLLKAQYAVEFVLPLSNPGYRKLAPAELDGMTYFIDALRAAARSAGATFEWEQEDEIMRAHRAAQIDAAAAFRANVAWERSSEKTVQDQIFAGKQRWLDLKRRELEHAEFGVREHERAVRVRKAAFEREWIARHK